MAGVKGWTKPWLTLALLAACAAALSADLLSELTDRQARAPGDPAAAGRLAMYYHAHEEYAQALPWYAKARELAPASWRWPYLAGLALMESARPDEAVAPLAKARELAPDQECVGVILAQVLMSLGDLAQAETVVTEALQQQAESASLLAELGLLKLAQGEFESAASQLRRALQLQPEANRLRHPLASALRASGEREAASVALAGAGKQAPRFDDPAGDEMRSLSQSYAFYMSQGLLAASSGDLDAARQLLERALTASPENPTVGVNYARVLETGGDLAGARAALRRVLSHSPEHAPAWLNLGVLAELEGRDVEALENYQAAVNLDPGDFRSRLLAGSAALRSGQMLLAAQQFAKASGLKPERDELLMNQAVALWAVDCRRAIDVALRLVERRPEDPAALLLYIRLASTCADAPPQARANALNAARNLSRLHPGPVMQVSLAMAEAASGNFQRAAELQQAAAGTLASGITAEQRQALAALLSGYRAGKLADLPFVLNEQVLSPPRLTPANRR